MELAALYDLFLQCGEVTTDSRHCPQGSMFFALKGDTFDGNRFAEKALEAGCAYAVVDDPGAVCNDRCLLVDNVLLALQQLARMHRRRLGTPLLAITGTNGKTTTKELVAAVLSCSHRVLYTQGNLNNHIGVPLTLLRLTPGHDMAVVEMGASHPGDIKELVDIAEPDYGLITNVGKAHLQGFGSFEGVVRTKAELYDYLRAKGDGLVFLHRDNPYLVPLAEGMRQVCYGSGEGLYVTGGLVDCNPYLTFSWHSASCPGLHTVSTRLIGGYNLSNALAAVAVGLYFGTDPSDVDRAISGYVPCNNRSQLARTARNTLIIDAYNANPTSMRAALDNFGQMDAPHKAVILGDMRELGADSGEEHRRVVDYLCRAGFEKVYLVGGEFASVCPPFPVFPTANELIEELKAHTPEGYTILIKGSNGVHLSSVAGYL